jgi:hypothetical protein
MKKILIATILGLSVLSYGVAQAEPETKKACVTQKDPKTGKEKEVCKTIKVHKKLDGTKVPEKK